MLFNKALVLSANNWKVMVKALFCQVLILVLVTGFCFLVFGGLVDEIVQAFSSVNGNEFLSEIFTSIQNGTFYGDTFLENLRVFVSRLKEAAEAIPNVWNRVEVSYASCILLVFVYRLLISFSDVAVGFQLHEFMTSNSERPFLWYAVKKFGESWRFIFAQMLLTLPLDALILVGGVGIGFLFAISLKAWGILPAAIIILFLYASRQTYCAFWLPALVSEDLNVRQSLTKGISTIPYRFWRVFWKTLVVVCIMLAIAVLSVLYVRNPIWKLVVGTVPNLVLFFLLKCINFVEYFEATSRPYFFKKVDVEGTERFNKKMERRNKREKKGKIA